MTLEAYADGRVRVTYKEECGRIQVAAEYDTDVEISVNAGSLIEAVPLLISRFAEMQQACMEQLRDLGVKFQRDIDREAKAELEGLS